MSPAPHPPVIVPDNITLARGRDGHVTLTIDGEQFPYAISSADPVTASVRVDNAPTLHVTLVAKTLDVRDQLLAGVDLAGHDNTTAARVGDDDGDEDAGGGR